MYPEDVSVPPCACGPIGALYVVVGEVCEKIVEAFEPTWVIAGHAVLAEHAAFAVFAEPFDKRPCAVDADCGICALFFVAFAVYARSVVVEVAMCLVDDVVGRVFQIFKALVDVGSALGRAPSVACDHYCGAAVDGAD